MTDKTEMPKIIHLIENKEFDDDDDNRIIWTTDIDVYPDSNPVKYIRADLVQMELADKLAKSLMMNLSVLNLAKEVMPHARTHIEQKLKDSNESLAEYNKIKQG